MKFRVSAVASKTSELLKSFIVMAMKTMFRDGMVERPHVQTIAN